MTREDVKKLFPDATEEQITGILNRYNADVKAEKDKLEQTNAEVAKMKEEISKYKADANKVGDLEKRLKELKDAAKNANEIQLEAAEDKKKLAESNDRIADLESQIAEVQSQLKRTETLKALADKGIVGEDADKFFNEDGSLNFDTLGKVISDRETAAAEKKEQEIANGSTNPGGGGNNEKQEDEKPYDVQVAERIQFGGVPENAQEIRNYYK